MPQKVGRYAPCPCGSGLKFNKCCGTREPPSFPASDYQKFLKDPRFGPMIDAIRGSHRKLTFTFTPSITDQNNRYRYRLVGNHIYRRPFRETFHEFLIQLFKWTLGREWHEEQLALPFQGRHQIFKWFRAATEFSKSLITNARFTEGEHYGDTPTGEVQALAALTYDVFHLLQIGAIPANLLERLKDQEQFQGARYEILVAAILMRSGCIPEFTYEKSKKHCDIITNDVITGVTMAVEAKTRRWMLDWVTPVIAGVWPGFAQMMESCANRDCTRNFARDRLLRLYLHPAIQS